MAQTANLRLILKMAESNQKAFFGTANLLAQQFTMEGLLANSFGLDNEKKMTVAIIIDL